MNAVPLCTFPHYKFLQWLKCNDLCKKCWIICCGRVRSKSWLIRISWRGCEIAGVNFNLSPYIKVSVELKIVHNCSCPINHLWLYSRYLSLTAECMCITTQPLASSWLTLSLSTLFFLKVIYSSHRYLHFLSVWKELVSCFLSNIHFSKKKSLNLISYDITLIACPWNWLSKITFRQKPNYPCRD
jgi:hypothetical protein